MEFTDPDRYAALEVAGLIADEMSRNAGQATRASETMRTSLTGPGAGLCSIAGMAVGLTMGMILAAIARRSRNL